MNMNNRPQFLTLPVGHNYQRQLSTVTLDHEREKVGNVILKTIQQSYIRFSNFADEWDEFQDVFRSTLSKYNSLVEINISLIKYFCSVLDLQDFQLLRSSEYVLSRKFGNPTERYLYLCNKLKLTALLTGTGKSLTVHDFQRLSEAGIIVYIQDFSTAFAKVRHSYSQIRPELSIIDTLFRIGRCRAGELVKQSVFEPRHLFSGI